MIASSITAGILDPSELLRQVSGPGNGAVLLFLGTVRDHNENRPVSGIRYESFVAMGEGVLRDLAEEAAARWKIGSLVVSHRIGELAVGEISVAIAVSAAHREEAYAASRYVIEQIKARLPVWKEERYADGEARWLDGVVPGGNP